MQLHNIYFTVKPISYLRHLSPFLSCHCWACLEITLASISQNNHNIYFNKLGEQIQSPKMANFSLAVI